jgi:hypothetical protein
VLYSLSKGIKTYHIPVKSGYSYERIQLNGSWAICRKINGANGFMFAMDSTSLLCGEQGFNIENIHLANIEITAQTPIKVANVSQLSMENVTLNEKINLGDCEK